MDFFAMKRKKLQSYCKTHGIPRNLKNVEMAKQLSLIYQGEENTNHVSRRLQSDKIKKPIEIIILDSDSDTDVQMEVSDVVGEKDCNEKNNVRAEHLLDEVPDQCVVKSDLNIHHEVDSGITGGNADVCELMSASSQEESNTKLPCERSDENVATSYVEENRPMSVNKEQIEEYQELYPLTPSDLDVHHIVDSDTVAGNDSNEKTDFGAENLPDEEPNQFQATCPLSEAKSDLNIHHMIDSGIAVGHVDACEVKSASSQKTGRGGEESKMKSPPERSDNVGSVNKEQIEDYLELHHATPSEGGNVLEQFGNYMMMGEQFGGHLLDEEPDQFLTTPPSEVKYDHKVDSDTTGVKVVSDALANDLAKEVVDVDDKFDLPEDVSETSNGSNEARKQGSIYTSLGSKVKSVDLLHVSPVESSSPFQKSDDNVMHGGDYYLGNCGFAVDVFCSHDKFIAAEDTDEKTIVSMENHPCEGHSPSGKYSDVEDLQLAASAEFGKKLAEVEFDLLEDDCETARCKDEALNSSSIKSPQRSIVNDFNLQRDSLGDFSSYSCFRDESIVAKNTDRKNNESMQKISYKDTCEAMLKSSEKSCIAADPEECIGFSPYDIEASTNKGFEVEPCFDPNTLGDVGMETCNMNESMQIDDMMEKEDNQGKGRNFFENSDVHDDIGGVGAEHENQLSETASRKRKRSDANSDEEVKDELVPTVPQTSEMDSSNFSFHQLFASETASGDEDAYQKKLDSPSKATPMIHKENIKFDKKEEVGSVMSRNKFAKRQPLQDLKQN